MSDDKELDASPTLAGRVGEGIKQGIVGLGLGAAAGYVTGVALPNLVDLTPTVNDINENAKEVIGQTGEAIINNVRQAADNIGGMNFTDVVGRAIGGDTAALSDVIKNLEPVDIEKAVQAVQTQNEINVLHEESKAFLNSMLETQSETLADPITLAKAGAIAGGTFKAGEGFLSNQADKRQDLAHAVQQQQIQGVGQLAGMALAASASANEGLKVLGKHTERLLKERQAQHTAVDNKPSLT